MVEISPVYLLSVQRFLTSEAKPNGGIGYFEAHPPSRKPDTSSYPFSFLSSYPCPGQWCATCRRFAEATTCPVRLQSQQLLNTQSQFQLTFIRSWIESFLAQERHFYCTHWIRYVARSLRKMMASDRWLHHLAARDSRRHLSSSARSS